MATEVFGDVESFEQIFEALTVEELDRLRRRFGRLQAYEVVPKLFEDSTHHIFKLFFSDTPVPLICKLCVPMALQENFSHEPENSLSPSIIFWSRIRQLFDFNACQSLKNAQIHYQWMQKHTTFHIAKLYGVATSTEPFECGFLLQEFIEGINCHRSYYTQERARKLADHLMAMHQHHFQRFGVLAEVFQQTTDSQDSERLKAESTELWWTNIAKVIETIPAGKVLATEKTEALAMIEALKTKRVDFVPQLVDFRWDQIRSGLPSTEISKSDVGQCYLLDLDALVIAPLEFEWVMLELVLTQEDMEYLIYHYHQGIKIPLIHDHRLVYRMVFFAMNLLGEMSWEEFKQQPKLLN